VELHVRPEKVSAADFVSLPRKAVALRSSMALQRRRFHDTETGAEICKVDYIYQKVSDLSIDKARARLIYPSF
jgi:hypothetical protein